MRPARMVPVRDAGRLEHDPARAVLSLLLMHGFIYSVDLRGGSQRKVSSFSVFARFTVVGYAVVLLVSPYVWTFGHSDGASLEEIISASVVLGFPGAIGAHTTGACHARRTAAW